jgi:cytochrome c peroxidase
MIVDAYGRSDWVKVLDFGLARLGSDTSQLTLEGAVLGTPQFMSPEQATEGKADARSDLYALGCVMFAMATGEGPFPGDELMAILYQHVNDPRPLISERSSTVYPAWLEQLILRLMAKSPEDRPQSCHEVTEILESIQEGTVPEAISQPIPILAPSPKQSKGRRMLMALILGLAILGGVLGYNASISDVKLPDYPEIREMGYEALPDYAITTKTNPITKDKVQLGRLLFFDPRLSKDDSISCSSCHDLQHFGVDNKRFSRGVGDQSSDRNSPTVFNTAGQFAQGWDGAFKSVEAQAIHPITHAKEMDSSEVEVVAKLSAIPEYQRLFRKTFGKAEPLISLKHIGIALGAFERKLLTPAPWDRFLKGDRDAINSDAKAGFVVFNQHCVNCHDGTYLGGQKFRKVGIKKKWFNTKDKGRFELTGKKRDMLKFKVPGLRNVAKTAPYFHDGSVASLTEAVRIMGEYQATPLSDEEISKIVAWLETLTGEPPAALISKPTLPGKKPSNP